MINLRNSPFLWFALLLMASYIIVEKTRLPGVEAIILTLLAALLLCAAGNFFKFKPGKQLIPTLLLSLCVLMAGAIRKLVVEQEYFPHQIMDQGVKMEATVEVVKVLKAKSDVSTLQCKVINTSFEKENEQSLFADQYMLVRVKGQQQKQLFPRDQLTIRGWLFPMKAPQNPHAFDLREYYKTIGIRHQITCADSNTLHHPAQGRGLMSISARWQATLCAIINQNLSPDVAQMTNALVFGERSAMDEEIRDAFANSGAMHVLSVSGMHMAIIYSMLYLLLGAPGQGLLLRRVIRLMLYFISIAIYVGLTGASPAVLRAGVMIMLFILGKAMGWNTQIWNLLGFAAFVMLWNNPFIWQNIGFQLSFLAMAGILLYAKPIIRYLSFKNIILHRIWEITAVSIAAQVFIIPIILHQFYQLPLTFIMSSLVAMPASYLIIFGALVNIALSPLQLDWLWLCFDYIGKLFLLIMKWLAGLNPEMNFSMPVQTELILLLSVLLFSFGLIYEWPSGKKWALGLSITSLLTLGWHRTTQWTTNDLTIYHNYSGLVMDLIVHGRCISLQDSAVADRQVEFTTRGNRVFRDIIHMDKLAADKVYRRANWYFSASGFQSSVLNFVIWNGDLMREKPTALSTYLLIDHCPDVDALKNHLNTHKAYCAILPVHLDRKIKKEIVMHLEDNNIKYWDIETNGYFRLLL